MDVRREVRSLRKRLATQKQTDKQLLSRDEKGSYWAILRLLCPNALRDTKQVRILAARPTGKCGGGAEPLKLTFLGPRIHACGVVAGRVV